MTRITRAGVRAPWHVLVLWLAGVIALTIIGLPLSKKLNPPQLGRTGAIAVADELSHGNFGEDAYALLFGSRGAVRSQGPHVVAALERATGAPIISPFSGLGRASAALWPHGGPAVVIVALDNAQPFVPDAVLERFNALVRSTVRAPLRAVVSGPGPLRKLDTDESLQAASTASALAFPALLLVLLLVFRSVVAAVVPLAVAGATVLGGKGVLVLLAKVINIDATSDVQLSMIGLALGVDYSLLIVTRYREALASGDSRGHAVHVASHTAGKTASFAGLVLTGILGVTLVLAPPGALASAAAGAVVATGMSVFSALVVVPALLTLLGRWISPLPSQSRGVLGRLVDGVLRRPQLALLAAVPLIVVALETISIQTVAPTPLALPADSGAGRALAAEGAAGFGAGVNVVMSRAAGPLTAPTVLRPEQRLEHQLRRLAGVEAVIGPGAITAIARGGLRHDRSGFDALASASAAGPVPLAAIRYALNVGEGGGVGRITVITTAALDDAQQATLFGQIDRLTAAFAAHTGVRLAVGGDGPESLQFTDQTNSRLPWIIFGIALVTFLALVAVLRSVLLAGIAVGLNMLSVATMFGALSFLYSGSHPILGRTGGIDVISIVSIFAITFALSIDYQVFLLTRMREGYLESQDAVRAIRYGVERTARIVTGAALIMLATFGAFATTSISNIQQIGVGLATAIAVDASLVRLVILPAILYVLDKRTWWLPDRLERRLPELDVEGFAYVRARSELASRAADVW